MRLNNAGRALTGTKKRALAKLKKKGGIYFDKFGFPDFEPFAYQNNPSKFSIDLEDAYTGSSKDFAFSNKKVGFKRTPAGYTWHHLSNCKKLILVDRDVHSQIGHTGGVATSQVKTYYPTIWN